MKKGAAERLEFANNETLRNLCGEQDKNIRLIEKVAAVHLMIRGNAVSISGDRIFLRPGPGQRDPLLVAGPDGQVRFVE